MKILAQLKLENRILTVITQSFKNTDCLRYVRNFPRVPSFFADFTIGMIGNKTGHLLICEKLYRKFININET